MTHQNKNNYCYARRCEEVSESIHFCKIHWSLVPMAMKRKLLFTVEPKPEHKKEGHEYLEFLYKVIEALDLIEEPRRIERKAI